MSLNNGSAFNGNSTRANRPISHIQTSNRTNYVSLSEWCERNFITRRVGYSLIKRRLLIAQRLYGEWWVTSNPDCYQELLDYLGIDVLLFDADNSVIDP